MSAVPNPCVTDFSVATSYASIGHSCFNKRSKGSRILCIFLALFFILIIGVDVQAQNGALFKRDPDQSSVGFGQNPNTMPAGQSSLATPFGGSPITGPGGGPRGRSQRAATVKLQADDSVIQSKQQAGDDPTLGELPKLSPTRFQQFVLEATGAELSLHGYKLFERGRFSSLYNVPVPSTYVLGPGDEIDLKIWGAVDLSTRLEVDRDGQVMIPRVGPVSLIGIAANSLDSHLKKQISKVFTNFEVSATVGKLRSIQIFVLGQARNPGTHVVSSLSTLINAIFESGGPSATGSMRRVELIRSGRRVASIDLYQFIQTGDMGTDVRLLPGDVILIPPAGPRVALNGAIDNAAIFELAPGQDDLGSVLAHSGASLALVTPHKALVERVDKQKVNGAREVKEIVLDEAGLKTHLRDGDLVTFLKLSPKFGNAVTLRGNVARALRYAFKPGMRISDLIPSTEALVASDYYEKKNILVQYEKPTQVTVNRLGDEVRFDLPEVNWEYASIERLDNAEIRTTLITFNLGRAVRDKDPEHDLKLKAGDIVTIYSVRDFAVPASKRSIFVKVSGEVNAAGIYQISGSETLTDLIKRAGGLTANAYVFGTVLTRVSTQAQQQLSLAQLVRRAEERLNSQASLLAQNLLDPDKVAGAQAQLASQRAAVERLRTLRPSGRVALELSPKGKDLPAISLEDGDQITVPQIINFIGVYGAVMAETTFIHRDGGTVQDYLDKAGLTREADLDGLMVIRADGTISANQAAKTWIPSIAGSFSKTPIYPGDSIFVPELIDKRTAYTQFIQGAKDWTQLFYQFGLGAAAIRTLRN